MLGASPWQTPYELWQIKLGLVEPEVTPAMLRGAQLEPAARAAYEQQTGLVMQPLVVVEGEYSASLEAYPRLAHSRVISRTRRHDRTRMRTTDTLASPSATRDDAAREAVRQAELQALADRVRQLENEVEVARRTVPPPSIAYIPVAAPAPVQYQSELAPAPSGWCDPTWASCWGLWGSGFYPASVVVVRGHNFHHFPRGHDRPGSPVQRPVRGPPAFRGR